MHLSEQFSAPALPARDMAGVFEQFWQLDFLAVDALEGINWSWLAMDSAMTNAPLSGEKTAPNPTD